MLFRKEYDRYEKRREALNRHRWIAEDWNDHIKPLFAPRWLTQEWWLDAFYGQHDDYLVLDRDWPRMRILVAPKWWAAVLPAINAKNWLLGKYWSGVHRLIRWAEGKGWMKMERGVIVCPATVWQAIKARK